MIVLGAAGLDVPFAATSDTDKTLVLRCKNANYATDRRCGDGQRVYPYPDILHLSQFCLVLDHSSIELLDAMMMVSPTTTSQAYVGD